MWKDKVSCFFASSAFSSTAVENILLPWAGGVRGAGRPGRLSRLAPGGFQSWGVTALNSPVRSQRWACCGTAGPETSQLPSSQSCLWSYGILVLFTSIYCSIPTFLLISDHTFVRKDGFRDKITFGAARIVYIRKKKSIWNVQYEIWEIEKLQMFIW